MSIAFSLTSFSTIFDSKLVFHIFPKPSWRRIPIDIIHWHGMKNRFKFVGVENKPENLDDPLLSLVG